MKDINIILGRFQPFTLGHLKCCEYAMKVKNVPSVICMIETKVSDAKHPFLSTDLLPMLKDLPEKLIEDVVLVKSADIVKLTEILHEQDYNPISWTCGSDRIETYTRQATRYGEKAGLPSDFEVLEVPRSDDDISATKVREALKSGDKKTFEKMMPKESHKYFDKLSEIIKSLNESRSLTNFLLEYLVSDINDVVFDEEVNDFNDANVFICDTQMDLDGRNRNIKELFIRRNYVEKFREDMKNTYIHSLSLWDKISSLLTDPRYSQLDIVEIYWFKGSRSGIMVRLIDESKLEGMMTNYRTITNKHMYSDVSWNTWLSFCGATKRTFKKK